MNLLKAIKALADENRLRIVNLLSHQELCVCEMEQVLGMTQSNVSRHLTKLKDTELIISEKQGQFVFHRLNPDSLLEFPFLESLVNQELNKIKKCREDVAKLQSLKDKNLLCERESCCKQ